MSTSDVTDTATGPTEAGVVGKLSTRRPAMPDTPADHVPEVLFVCVHNAGRAPMDDIDARVQGLLAELTAPTSL